VFCPIGVGAQVADLVDRVRLVEILTGPDEALAMLWQAATIS
jgi:hypothetical protein